MQAMFGFGWVGYWVCFRKVGFHFNLKKIKKLPFFLLGIVQINRVGSEEICTLFGFRKQCRKMDAPLLYLFGSGGNKLLLSGSGINYFWE